MFCENATNFVTDPVWFLRYGAWRTEFFVILDYFLHFYPLNNPKNQNLEKMKKTPGDIIILHKCAKTHGDMLYCSWDTIRDGCNSYFLFSAIFCPLGGNDPKIKIWRK